LPQKLHPAVAFSGSFHLRNHPRCCNTLAKSGFRIARKKKFESAVLLASRPANL
jgi:hypothetical protein